MADSPRKQTGTSDLNPTAMPFTVPIASISRQEDRTVSDAIDFECASRKYTSPPRKPSREALVRNARARRKLERKRDRERLRKHLEEVWN